MFGSYQTVAPRGGTMDISVVPGKQFRHADDDIKEAIINIMLCFLDHPDKKIEVVVQFRIKKVPKEFSFKSHPDGMPRSEFIKGLRLFIQDQSQIEDKS